MFMSINISNLTFLLNTHMSSVNMEDTMIVEGLGTVSFVNGILKVQTVGINSAGEVVETGQIEIPGSRVGDVINGLTKAVRNSRKT